ncbi:MAG: N-acetyltransferase [Phycisphaerales bacterium]|nr:N-acetyltransferase [Phycisphaerales bacterium]
MVIRAARESDLPGVFAIYDREVLHGTCTFDTVPKTEAERLEWFRADGGGRYPILVAEEAGRLAGWARLYQWSPRPAYARAAENAVYVDVAFRGRGVGRALMDELLRLAYAAGIRVVIARVVEGNPASRALHEAMGFTTIGVMHQIGEKFGRVLDVRMMERVVE